MLLLLFSIVLLGFSADADPLPRDEVPAEMVVCAFDAPRQPCALTAHRTGGGIAIDAILDEADWQAAPVAAGFTLFEPVEGGTPSQPTEVRILYGDDAVYVGAMLYDDAPGAILRTLGRRDDINQADWFIVSIDSYYDRKTAYSFGVNAAGVQMDGLTTDDMDTSWDALWTSDVAVTDEGWVVEMRIPYSMLRFGDAERQTWGINFQRIVPRNGETSEWVMVPRTERSGGVVARYGVLQGVRDIQPRRTLQVTPYTVSGLRLDADDAGDPFQQRTADVGGDLKLGLSSSLTLDLTVNPDFGQVDADPAELNLSAFETFFPERRPFFIEGVQIFDYSFGGFGGDGSLLYTRRIGADEPIIGAAKLSGRTDGGLSIGVLSAATGDAFSPNRTYGIGRLKQEVGTNSFVGAMITGYDHAADLAGDQRRSLTGGVDWDLRFGENTYGVQGHVSTTHRRFPGLDEAPQTGLAFAARLDKLRGAWTYYTSINAFSDGFDPSDIGRVRQRDFVRYRAGFGNQLGGGGAVGPFRRAEVRLFTWHDWTLSDGTYQGSNAMLRSEAQLPGFQEIDLGIEVRRITGGVDVYETRGLGPFADARSMSLEASFRTDERRAWRLRPNAGLSWDARGGRNHRVGLRGRWNAGSRLSLSGGAGLRWEDDVTAWAANESFRRTAAGWQIGTDRAAPDALSDDAYTAFDDGGLLDAIVAPLAPFAGNDAFYLPIFGERDTRQVELSLRGNVTFTPTLSLQLFSQLFLARGRYERFAILQDAETLAPFVAYPKHRDFARTSFLSNVVLRWEYRPGSALFVVWSQNRLADPALDPFALDAASPYDRAPRDQVNDVFGLYPTNVFMVKLSYTFLR